MRIAALLLLTTISIAAVASRTPVRLADGDPPKQEQRATNEFEALPHPAFVHDVWRAGRWEGDVPQSTVASVGGGLSFVDSVLVVDASINPAKVNAALQLVITEVEKRTLNRWTIAANGNYPPDTTQPIVIVALASAARRASANPCATAALSREERAHAHTFAAKSDDIFSADSGSSSESVEWCALANGGGISGRTGPVIYVFGATERAVLFGLGQMLQAFASTSTGGELSYTASYSSKPAKSLISLAAPSVRSWSTPAYPLRGHQLAYRSMSDSYDTWTVADMHSYIRDLVVFGTNQIEMVAPDGKTSPLFTLANPADMHVAVSQYTADLNIRYSLWWPLAGNYQPSGGELFNRLPNLNSLFIPGGDGSSISPGPAYFMELSAAQANFTRRWFPDVEIWVSAQTWNDSQMNEFYDILNTQPLEWLTGGIAYSPHQADTIVTARSRVPQRFRMRHYPDICHALKAEFDNPLWDPAFGLTEGRESISTRNQQMASIFQRLSPYASFGFGTYSDGIVDDSHKNVWSQLGWTPTLSVDSLLRAYANWFITSGAGRWTEGTDWSGEYANGLIALENQWFGAITDHAPAIEQTRAMWESILAAAPFRTRMNWRLYLPAYRAVYDAFLSQRTTYEQSIERTALHQLSTYKTIGPANALAAANDTILAAPLNVPAQVTALRARVFTLGEALWQTIHLKLSTTLYGAIGTDRGASLDTIDYPLTGNPYWSLVVDRLAASNNQTLQIAGIEYLINWREPCATAAFTYYDDTGSVRDQPHLIEHDPIFTDDPYYYNHSLSSTTGMTQSYRPIVPWSWLTYAGSFYDSPVRMRYTDLPSINSASAQWVIRVVYWGDDINSSGGITLLADAPAGGNPIVIHSAIQPTTPPAPLQFVIPSTAISSAGVLSLNWWGEAGRGGSGRGDQIAEVWLMAIEGGLSACPLPASGEELHSILFDTAN